MVFRTNFVLFWLFCNGIYYVVVLQMLNNINSSTIIVNSGQLTYFEVFSLYLAGIVVFRVFFSSLYLLLWRIRYGFLTGYTVIHHSIEEEFKRVKKTCLNGDSSDDEHMDELLNTIFKENKEKIIKMTNDTNQKNILDATLDFIQSEDHHEDSDDDQREFDDAGIEEAEDRLLTAYS